MNRKTFIKSLLFLGTFPSLLRAKNTPLKSSSSIRLLRHATLILEMNGKKLLIDPMLSEKDAMDPIRNCGNDIRIPMVELPIPRSEINTMISEMDAIVITHLHRDHWDAPAKNLIPNNKLIFCSPNDEENLRNQGFENVQNIENNFSWQGIEIHRTSGQHGTGDIGKSMGPVSGFVFKHQKDSIYLAGDTVWCEEVENTLTNHRPKVTILNAGGAKFLTGDPITMTSSDIVKVHEKLPDTKIIAVHMDTINHCFVTREILFEELKAKDLDNKISIPKDGESIEV
ncbi:MBL fold metallo-hydrolase [Algoriphagus lutimaris]|uniref:MBL fold metallo-hydrolase n=1 Tax=Algoriphagus lutimaris TaxID=613197 RepID=UPI00196B3650|nr:MBL fold metallo-hydrolase [Algoriphagus lutimaris]MBN3522029.1 MBL fold metallo-hydrolase [Algoriphagus lutimaris]